MNQDYPQPQQDIIRNLGDGLVLRKAGPSDTEELASFLADVNRHVPFSPSIAIWTRDLVERPIPTSSPTDFTIVQDTRAGKIVSSLNLISQTWSYAGIEFGVGRPELVSTDPEYRRRGLIRQQFEVIHEWSSQRGEKVQAVSGIPWLYRQFGYETLWVLDTGLMGYKQQVPDLVDDCLESYRLRPANSTDIYFISNVYKQAQMRSLVCCIRDQAMWHFELTGRSLGSYAQRELRIVESNQGETVGFIAHKIGLSARRLDVVAYELKPGVSWFATTPAVLCYLLTTGEEYAQRDEGDFSAFAFCLGTHHPVCQVLYGHLLNTRFQGAWYLRVPDVPDFVRHVSQVLEKNLAESALAGHSQTLDISFYRQGLRLVLETGRLVGVESWKPSSMQPGDAAFADCTFLQLLFGFRSVAEFDFYYPDCWIKTNETRALLDALFPKQPSYLWAIE
jgi:hypothetical protein